MIIVILVYCFFFFKQKTAYEMRISDWSSDVCSSDLIGQECTRFSVTLADDVAQCDRPGIQVDRCLHVTRLDVWGVIPTEGVGNSRIADIDAAAQEVIL